MNILSLKTSMKTTKAKLENNLNFTSKRESYLRGFFYINNNKNYVKCLSNQDSSLLKTLSNSNCLIKVPSNKKYFKGDAVQIKIFPFMF